jgi:23S rRNA (uracil1939-C5)-methyltransferase
MARHAGKVIGAEIVPEAVGDAAVNADLNGISNAEFFCADAAAAAERIAARGDRIDVVTVDPPRKGLGPDAVEAVLRLAPRRIVYVSCDPATLARDLRQFAAGGYAVDRVRPVDMFPRTPHVECVVLMSRAKE